MGICNINEILRDNQSQGDNTVKKVRTLDYMNSSTDGFLQFLSTEFHSWSKPWIDWEMQLRQFCFFLFYIWFQSPYSSHQIQCSRNFNDKSVKITHLSLIFILASATGSYINRINCRCNTGGKFKKITPFSAS